MCVCVCLRVPFIYPYCEHSTIYSNAHGQNEIYTNSCQIYRTNEDRVVYGKNYPPFAV